MHAIHRSLSIPAALTLMLGGCTGQVGGPPRSVAGPRPGAAAAASWAPEGAAAAPRDVYRTIASGPYPVELASLAESAAAPTPPPDPGPVERPISEQEVERLRREALELAPSPLVQALPPGVPGAAGVAAVSPVLVTSFEGPDITDVGGRPPDPELAVGESYLIAVVNFSFTVYDKGGAVQAGPISFSSFFANTPGCSALHFDPNAVYDEEAGRYVLGVDGGGSTYCIASAADPLGTWDSYAFATDPPGLFFDFPHAGIGRDAIYLGANIFSGGTFFEGRVYAIDKAALYAAAPGVTVVSRSTGGADSTPQPANLHGFAQGTWPTSGPHYILTDRFDGARHSVWSWSDPFGSDLLTKLADLDLNAATGVTAGFPLFVPQPGTADPCLAPDACLESNDWRGLDAEYRNGRLVMANTIACNPGSGSVNCVRWAEIDPATPAVIDAGVFSSAAEHRFFPDAAANHCGDLALGYSKSGAGLLPAVWFTGRRFTDPPATVGSEGELKAGETVYAAAEGPPLRWGDYTGLTADPGGRTLWYLGEYAKSVAEPSGRWGTFIGELDFGGCLVGTGHDFGAIEVAASSPAVSVEVRNRGELDGTVTALTLSDPASFSVDENGGAAPCGTPPFPLAAGASCTVEVTFHPQQQQVFAESLSVDSDVAANRGEVPLAGIGYHLCPHPSTILLTNAAPETGTVDETACERVDIGPYQLGAIGSLSVTAGETITMTNGTTLAGQFAAWLDLFLAQP